MTKTMQLTALICASNASAQSAETLNKLSLEQSLNTSLTEALPNKRKTSAKRPLTR